MGVVVLDFYGEITAISTRKYAKKGLAPNEPVAANWALNSPNYTETMQLNALPTH
jgi:hypothetical protein